jgi:hypothetical protein
MAPGGTCLINHPGHGIAQVVKDLGDKVLQLASDLNDSPRHSTLVSAHEVRL